jgi:hypothetical protein
VVWKVSSPEEAVALVALRSPGRGSAFFGLSRTSTPRGGEFDLLADVGLVAIRMQ